MRDMPPTYDRVLDTWRCDYDGATLLGGVTPSGMNWDDGVRASDAKINVDGPHGLRESVTAPEGVAQLAAG